MGSLQRAPGPPPTAFSQNPPRICRRERTSLVKNRMREICTSGSVRGEGGNILTYSAAVEQPGVQLLVARHSQPRREEPLAHQPDLVLDLPLLPTRRRRAGNRLDQVVAAHPQKAPIELAVLADEHGLDRRLHVVVDAAGAGPFEKAEGACMRVEDHLLALARIGAHKQHAAVTK